MATLAMDCTACGAEMRLSARSVAALLRADELEQRSRAFEEAAAWLEHLAPETALAMAEIGGADRASVESAFRHAAAELRRGVPLRNAAGEPVVRRVEVEKPALPPAPEAFAADAAE